MSDLTVGVQVDDEWQRRGLVAGIQHLGGIFGSVWGDPIHTANGRAADVIIVGVNVDDPWDRLGGFHQLSRHATDTAVRTIAVAKSMSNPLLALRAKEAGADVLCSWCEIADLAGLERVLLTPPVEWRPAQRLDFRTLKALGVSPQGRPAAGLELIAKENLHDVFDRTYNRQLTRRKMITLRQRLADTIGVRPAGTVTASANQPTKIPGWNQLRLVVDLARGIAALGDQSVPGRRSASGSPA